MKLKSVCNLKDDSGLDLLTVSIGFIFLFVIKENIRDRLWPIQVLYSMYSFIMITCPCNVYPLIPHFYIAKLGYAWVHLFFLFLYSYPQSMF